MIMFSILIFIITSVKGKGQQKNVGRDVFSEKITVGRRDHNILKWLENFVKIGV